MKIQKPTLGRIVEYKSSLLSQPVVAFVDHCYGTKSTPDGRQKGVVNLHVLSISSEFVGVAWSVPPDASGESAPSWRYPPRCTEEIEVER